VSEQDRRHIRIHLGLDDGEETNDVTKILRIKTKLRIVKWRKESEGTCSAEPPKGCWLREILPTSEIYRKILSPGKIQDSIPFDRHRLAPVHGTVHIGIFAPFLRVHRTTVS
jgi:hypothetical protein